MSVLDLSKYLEDLPGDKPCGDNLEYDPDFLELERLLQGRPASQFDPGEPPDWKAVRKVCLSLLERTRDLRITVTLTRALLHVDGLPGLADGFTILGGLITRSWPMVHPQLDPGDGNDPVMRVNAIATLCDADSMLNPLRDSELAAAQSHGRFSLRAIEMANGEVPVPQGQEKPQAGAIHGAFMDMPIARLVGNRDSLRVALEQATLIEKELMRLVGAGQALDMSGLSKQLLRLLEVVEERLALRPDRPIEAPPQPEGTDGENTENGTMDVGPGGALAPARRLDQIGSRDDVVKALGLILDYYRNHEPSSPVPLLIERARRLVPLGFLEIIRELAPDHVAELEKLQGNIVK